MVARIVSLVIVYVWTTVIVLTAVWILVHTLASNQWWQNSLLCISPKLVDIVIMIVFIHI